MSMSDSRSPRSEVRMADGSPSPKRTPISDRPKQASLFDPGPPPCGLRSMPLAEAVDCLAALNGGRVESTEARRTLVDFRILPDDHRGVCRLYYVLADSGRFSKLGHGKNRLERPYQRKDALTQDQEELLRRLRGGA